jgi:serine/threonine protein kinase
VVVGATLFAAVEGRSPFQREGQLSTLTAIVSEAPPDAPHAGALGPVIEQLLAKDPAERPSAAETRLLLQEAALAEQEITPAREQMSSTVPAPPVPKQPQLLDHRERGSGAAQAAPEPATTARRPWALVILTALALLGVAAGGLYLLLPDRPSESTVAPPVSTDGSTADRSEASSPSPATTPARSPSPTAQATTSRGGSTLGRSAVPAGFRMVADPSGFRIAIPDGWTRSRTDTRTYFKDPAGGRYLMVDQTTDPKPDALTDWQRQEVSVSQRLSG